MSRRVSGNFWMQVSSKLRPAVFLAAACWILFAFHYYLPALSPLRWLDFWLRRTGGYDILLVLWFAAVAHCVGKCLLHLIGVKTSGAAEESAFSIAAGAMMFSWSTLILSLIHGLYRPVAYALLLVPTVIWYRELRALPGAVYRALMRRAQSASWTATAVGGWFIVAYVSVVLGFILISALGPSYEYDDLVYHLTGPKNFVLAHRLVPLPDVPLIFLPKNIEMLHTLGMLWHNDIAAKLMVFLCGCITMVGVYGFLVRFVSRTAGIIAVGILASSPLFIWEMRTAHNDIGLTLFLFAGAYATVVWLRTREAPWFRIACLFLAFSLGVKYWASLALGIIVTLVFLTLLRQSRSWRPAFRAASRLGLYSALGLLPWCLINFYYTGNPVFPLLNGVFKSPYWTPAHTKMIMGELFQGGIRITFSNWWDIFRLPWEMMVDPRARFGGNIGPWYVIFIPFLLFFSGIGIELGFLVISGLLYYIGWAISGPWVRFLLPALPGLAAGAAFAIERLLQALGSYRRALAIVGATVLSLLALVASPFFESAGSWSRYGSPPIRAYPLRYLLNQESKIDYLRRLSPEFSAAEYLNTIPGEKKVLYVNTLADGFYLRGKAAFHYSPYIPGLVGADADTIHNTLRQHGITHLVVSQPHPENPVMSSRESDFTHKYLRRLFQRNTCIVYELLPYPVDQTIVTYDFIRHLDEMNAGKMHPGTPGSVYKAVREVSGERRYVLVMRPTSEADYQVKVPDHASLSFAAAREDPAHVGRAALQVWVSTSESERRLVYSRDMEGRLAGWIEHTVDLAEYAGHRVLITIRIEESSPPCNYFVADPILLAPSNSDHSVKDGWSPNPGTSALALL